MVEADVGALRPDDRSWEVQGRRETRSGWRLRVGWATTLFHTKSLRTRFPTKSSEWRVAAFTREVSMWVGLLFNARAEFIGG